MGPWQGRLPDDPRYDPKLLRDGDTRNVVDAYRYWTRDAIIADIDRRGTRSSRDREFGNDANIGAVVRTANAFAVTPCTSSEGAGGTGAARWSPTDTSGCGTTTPPQNYWRSRPSGADCRRGDNVPGALRLENTALPRRCLLIFGQEGPGITDEAKAGADLTVSIAQFGSTRSINAAVAAGIAMHTWIAQHADLNRAW